jgi:ribosome-binding factor A
MDIKGLKRLIKEAVREAIQEELKDILVEAVKAPKVPIGVGGYSVPNKTINEVDFSPKIDTRKMYTDIMGNFERGKEELSFNTNTSQNFSPQGTYVPGGMTAGIEGTLHPGEVGLDQIINLMQPK